jgi:hypothetical protein
VKNYLLTLTALAAMHGTMHAAAESSWKWIQENPKAALGAAALGGLALYGSSLWYGSTETQIMRAIRNNQPDKVEQLLDSLVQNLNQRTMHPGSSATTAYRAQIADLKKVFEDALITLDLQKNKIPSKSFNDMLSIIYSVMVHIVDAEAQESIMQLRTAREALTPPVLGEFRWFAHLAQLIKTNEPDRVQPLLAALVDDLNATPDDTYAEKEGAVTHIFQGALQALDASIDTAAYKEIPGSAYRMFNLLHTAINRIGDEALKAQLTDNELFIALQNEVKPAIE